MQLPRPPNSKHELLLPHLARPVITMERSRCKPTLQNQRRQRGRDPLHGNSISGTHFRDCAARPTATLKTESLVISFDISHLLICAVCASRGLQRSSIKHRLMSHLLICAVCASSRLTTRQDSNIDLCQAIERGLDLLNSRRVPNKVSTQAIKEDEASDQPRLEAIGSR